MNQLELEEFSNIDNLDFELITTDNYSDSILMNSVKKAQKKEILQACAIQTALVGTGSGVFGKISFKKEELDIKEVFKASGVKTDLDLNSKIGPDVMTPRRLQRLFRYSIHQYLKKNRNSYSYLFRKYSDHNENYREYVFPSAENMIDDKNSAKYLLFVYNKVDDALKTTIRLRIERVFLSRGILTISECHDVHEDFLKVKNGEIKYYLR